MARIRLVPLEELGPALRQIAKESEAHRLNPAIFQAAGNLPETFEAFWAFYAPLKFGGLLESKLKELVRLKIADLNQCAT
jgi:alkylhydroperoxidase family enzyme